jgi:ubiquinone/menaquinone biosynthesis C-methylase UbiE
MKKTPKQFYTELEPDGLAAWKNPIQTRKELAYLKKVLKLTQRILDLGCGYGRFTIPLAKLGYNIEGIDITPLLIKKAKATSQREKLSIRFKVGDMRSLPYKNEKFDAIICMWSVFIELYKVNDQVKAVKEMLRALADNGFALIEMPLLTKNSIKTTEGSRIRKGNIWIGKISGIEAMPHYAHSRKTLTALMEKTKVKRFEIFTDEFGGRERLFLQFWKSNFVK